VLLLNYLIINVHQCLLSDWAANWAQHSTALGIGFLGIKSTLTVFTFTVKYFIEIIHFGDWVYDPVPCDSPCKRQKID